MINNIVIIIKKRIGGKYAMLLGDFALESLTRFFSRNQICCLHCLQTTVAQSFFCPIPTSHIIILKVF